MDAKWLLVLALAAAPAALPPSPSAVDDLVFQGDPQGIPMLKLVETACDVTNEPFFYEPKDLSGQTVCFTGTVTVPRDRFLPFFDWCLRENEFVHLEQVSGGITLHVIRKLGQQARGQQALKAMARTVTPAELREMADRNTLITTTWISKSLPAREAVTTFQLYFADSTTESIRNVEGTNAVVMTGYASSVAAIIAMAERLDAACADAAGAGPRGRLEERVARLEEQLAKLQPAPVRPGAK